MLVVLTSTLDIPVTTVKERLRNVRDVRNSRHKVISTLWASLKLQDFPTTNNSPNKAQECKDPLVCLPECSVLNNIP